jgi:hypothetical protein
VARDPHAAKEGKDMQVVTSAWLGGMGLPDNGGDTAFNGVPDTAKDPHRGLLLSIVSITLLHDEGTDTASGQDPNGVGLAVVDNIFRQRAVHPNGHRRR